MSSKETDSIRKSGEEVRTTQLHRSRSEQAFWITLAVLFIGTVALVLLAALDRPASSVTVHQNVPSATLETSADVDIPATRLEAYVRRAAEAAHERTSALIESELDRLFGPVAAAVDDYADFHYSVLGEYAELMTAALRGSSSLWDRVTGVFRDDAPEEIDAETQEKLGNALTEAADKIETQLEAKLYAGFDERLTAVADRLDDVMFTTFETELQALVAMELEVQGDHAVLSEASRIVIDDALARAQIGKPLSATLAVGAGAVTGKLFAATLTKTALKTGIKTGLKTAAKPATVGGGAAGGAALGAFLGPFGAAAGGAAGALVAWFAVDYAVVKIDEAFNREEFVAELNAAITAQVDKLLAIISDALEAQRQALSGATLRERMD